MRMRTVVITTSGRHYEGAWEQGSAEDYEKDRAQLGTLVEVGRRGVITLDAEGDRRIGFNPEHVVAVYVEGKS